MILSGFLTGKFLLIFLSDTTQARSYPCNTMMVSTVHDTQKLTIVHDLEQWMKCRQAGLRRSVSSGSRGINEIDCHMTLQLEVLGTVKI